MRKQNGYYRSIKELIFDIIHQTKGLVDYETITDKVKEHFPESKWKKIHWAWYKIRSGRFKNLFSEQERVNLSVKKKDQAEKIEIKRVGDAILNHVRFVIKIAAGEDRDLQFKLNRWIYARLQQEEIRAKKPIKLKLWYLRMKSCQSCGTKFKTLKSVEIHRKDSTKCYSVENCILLCRSCHQKLS